MNDGVTGWRIHLYSFVLNELMMDFEKKKEEENSAPLLQLYLGKYYKVSSSGTVKLFLLILPTQTLYLSRNPHHFQTPLPLVSFAPQSLTSCQVGNLS